MKILKIAFKNINALRGEHTIDFTVAPFTTHSLFAITGPTGSGKSTILDVISLALFNNIPRLEKVSRGEILAKGAILTRNQKDAFAKVTYSCARGTFTSAWSISTNRNGNLRSHEMQLSNALDNQLFDLKNSEVPAKNEELIGLSYNQFIKSVLLAQGEFAQFIQAKKSERGDLLEKITGTGIYRKLGQMAYDRHKTENLTIKEHVDTIKIKSEALLPQEEFEEKTLSLKAKEKQIPPHEQQIELLNKNISLKESINKLQEDIKSLLIKKSATTKELKNFENEKGARLVQHERVAPFTEDIAQWQKNLQNKKETATEIQKIDTETIQIKQKIGNLKSNIFSFIKQETPETEISEALTDFAKKVDGLQKKLNEKRAGHKTVSALFDATMKTVGFTLSKNPDQDLSQLRELAETIGKDIDNLKSVLIDIRLDTPDFEKKRLNQAIKNLNEAFRHKEKVDQRIAKIENLKEELNTLKKEQQTLPDQIQKQEAKIDLIAVTLKKQQLELENQKLKASLREHRAHLAEGTPCPLCGALEHPFAENIPEANTSLQQKMQQIEIELQTVTNSKIQLQAKLELLSKNVTKQEQSLRDETAALNQLQKMSPITPSSSLLQDGDNAILNEKVFSKKINELEGKIEKTETFIKLEEQQKAITKGIPLLQELCEIRLDGLALKTELDVLFTGNDIYKETQNLLNQWTTLKEKELTTTKMRQELDKKYALQTAALDDLVKMLDPKIKTLDFNTITEAANAQLPHHLFTQLRGEKETLINRNSSIDTSLDTLNNQLSDLKKEDIKESTQDLLSKRIEYKERLEALRSENEKLRRGIDNHNDTLKEIDTLKKEIAEREKQIKRWRLLNELIGDATGKKFNEFAQDLTLSQLLKHANRRLADLSDRYVMDTPSAGEDDSLVAIDMHMGGQRRSVKTLSGGETFILSLSMALALSDLASRHVEINSLFIDEGFGTLDPETLDQTLDTLERLEAETSKTIGIISHVESLKERIAAQIQLKRHGQGYSTLSIK